ncbi:MAG: SpoIIE family protein phosphatase [Oscillospiraceae bacterium]|nr:SpoIIE family protein phosphatase [Oscillospiraceae bacterium]
MVTKVRGVFQGMGQKLAGFLLRPWVQLYGRGAAYVLAGFFLGAGSLFQYSMPLAAALVCGCTGVSALLTGIGSCLGYLFFWGEAGYQGIIWAVCGWIISLSTGKLRRQTEILVPALSALAVSAAGVAFQILLRQEVPLFVYLLRVALAGGCSWLFSRVLYRREPILNWLAGAVGILALAQVSLTRYFNIGILLAAGLTASGAFPGAALAGVALDLADITPVSMTAVLCAGYLVRFIPGYPRLLTGLMSGICYLLLMNLTGQVSFFPVPALFLGGLAGVLLPLPGVMPARRGETGVAQVRLELAAGAMLQTEQLLLEIRPIPVDADAILQRCLGDACTGCPCRGACKDSRRIAQLPAVILQKPLVAQEELPILCRKSGRVLAALHRGQEQLLSIQADRLRQEEYRNAAIQQYRFLGEYLQQLSDQLARKAEQVNACFSAQVQVFGNRREGENGDRWAVFAGLRDLQYVILCDGMGTGLGAVQEGKTALLLLRRLLTAGYPAPAALQSLNSICALRGRAGAVTVDLLEISLSNGKCRLYKWGAAPSYKLDTFGAEKLGNATPPPGISVTDAPETIYPVSLSRGERLVMTSDGVEDTQALHLCGVLRTAPAEVLAEQLLRQGQDAGEDDATVAVIQLIANYS